MRHLIKKLALFCIIAGCLALLAACGGKSDPTWQEQYDLGQQYLSEMNYEQAIVAFTEAIRIDPNRGDAYIGRGDAYMGLAEALAAAGDTAGAQEARQNAQKDYEAGAALGAAREPAAPGAGNTAAGGGTNAADAPAAIPEGFTATAAYTQTPAEPILGDWGALPAPVPVKTVPLTYLGSANTWQEIEAETGYAADTLRALNPQVLEDANGHLVSDRGPNFAVRILLQPDYPLPHTACREVQIDPADPSAQWEASRYLVPDALDEYAAVVLAEGLDFLYHSHFSMGYPPCEMVEGLEIESVSRALPGARFTTWTAFRAYLDALLTPEFAVQFLTDQSGGNFPPNFQQGENDELWFLEGLGIGSLPGYQGMSYTEPQLQADGSLYFTIISMQADATLEVAMQGEITGAEAVDHAYYIPVRLVPNGAGGWLVDELQLPE